MMRPLLCLLLACVVTGSVACSDETPAAPALSCFKSERNAFCQCSAEPVSDPANATSTCSAAALGEVAHCCASKGYPSGSGGSCACESYRCIDGDSQGCRCGLVTTEFGAKVVPSCSAPTGKECCILAEGDGCGCNWDKGTCPGTVVTSCTASALTVKCTSPTLSETVASCK